VSLIKHNNIKRELVHLEQVAPDRVYCLCCYHIETTNQRAKRRTNSYYSSTVKKEPVEGTKYGRFIIPYTTYACT